MFEHETDTIIRIIREHVFRSGATRILLKDILASHIPHPVKAFFRADAETLLMEEQQPYRKASRFPLDHPEVRNLQQQIDSILVLHFAFTGLEFQERLNGAVHMIINYLVRPQWTLTSVLFEKDATVSSKGLMTGLRYFGGYEYLKDILARYVQEKQIASITRKDFENLVWKIDGEYVRRKTGDELARVLSPLYEFMDYPASGGTNAIPTRGLLKYFEDKGLLSVVAQLEGELAQGRTALDRRQLAELLETVRRTTGAFTAERSTTGQAAAHVRAPEPEQASEHPGRARREEKSAPEASLSISEQDRRRFLKKIFRHNEEAFDSSIASLQTMTSWKQASKFIDEIFIQNDVDPYSSEAERFIELVFRHYNQAR